MGEARRSRINHRNHRFPPVQKNTEVILEGIIRGQRSIYPYEKESQESNHDDKPLGRTGGRNCKKDCSVAVLFFRQDLLQILRKLVALDNLKHTDNVK